MTDRPPVAPLHHRHLAVLRAVARGTAEITRSREPDLYVDGLPCCDQGAVRELVRTGLLHPAGTSFPGHRTTAALTELGRAVVGRGPGTGARSSTEEN
ncbi:hypothetical protein EIL87_02885 [Saccharopolyspora rhizosphaerae]|uniref:Uncharacterized protein n=1 Tax=Saccharopolyspora rhizosphaerae TaxID=2492662 RepID=A0A426K3A6_9PSEU|nr:hypothetical protein [Saccharopolyspora rhizosphaerae]RRO19942.1 hypothetical protein EIL87_02885 [Saccharopolyspora rhizosphaerae]